jgi:hypothetical protein
MRTLKIWTVQLGMLALTAAIPALASASQGTLYVSAVASSRLSQPPVPAVLNEQFYDGAVCPIPGPAPCIGPFIQVNAALLDTGPGSDGNEFSFLGSANASASFSALRAVANFGARNVYSGLQTIAGAGATAESADSLQFSAPGIAIAHVELHVRYTGLVGGNAGSSFLMEFGSSRAQFFANLGGSYDEDIVIGAPYDPLGILLRQRLIASAQVPQVVLNWTGSGQADFSHTAQISAIYAFDADGVQITNFTVQSESGTDYLAAIAAVPEPGSWALMLGGAAMLALRTRRRRG